MVPRRARLGPRRGELDGAVGSGSACEWSVALRVSSPMGLPSEGELCVRTTYEFLATAGPCICRRVGSRTTSRSALTSSSLREGRMPRRVS